MRTLWFVALLVGFSASFSGGQQADPSAPPKPDSQPARVKVYTVGPGVTAPELLPPNLAPIPTGKCKKKVDGKVVLSVLVDETGQPRNLMFLRPLGTDLDRLAFQTVVADRFNSGIHDGIPVVVAQSVEVDLQACDEQIKDVTRKTTHQLRLISQPVQKFSAFPQPPEEAVPTASRLSFEDAYNTFLHSNDIRSGISAPVPINNVEAEYTDEARRAHYEGVSIVSLIVDVYGRPQHMRIVRPLDYGLSEKAIEAVSRYRFKPAMNDGQPAPVLINVEVNFHLY
jgi:TonB family protein